jgi:HEAT repeat protein
MTTALLAVFAAWLVLSAWVVLDHVVYDRLVASVRKGSRRHRLRWRTLARFAADSSSDLELANALTTYVVETDEQRIVAAALDPGSGWHGIQAVRILARAGHPQVLPALERMLASDDEDVRAAAVTVLGGVEGERATALLIEALRTGACPPRWTAALLDCRPIPKALLLPLLEGERADVRAAATRLFARVDAADAEADGILLRLCADSEADVRAAVCSALGERGNTAAAECIVPMLRDPVWFVQVRAAKALGCLHDVTSAGKIAELLESPFWWVRQAAKDTLVDLGPEVKDQLLPWLDSDDAFARNSCAEVLQNLGILDDLLDEAHDASNPGRAASASELLRKILAAGGGRVVDAVAETAGSRPDDAPGAAPAAKVRAA